MSIQIPLTQDKFAIIDDEDFGLVKKYNWYALKDWHTYYAQAGIRLSKEKRSIIKMHRLILGLTSDLICDHVNCNGLDNRRINLRVATFSQNNANKRKNLSRTSIYKGVSWDKEKKKWRAQIQVNTQKTHLGYHIKEEEAAKAYNSAAIDLFGKFARLNIIPLCAVFLL